MACSGLGGREQAIVWGLGAAGFEGYAVANAAHNGGFKSARMNHYDAAVQHFEMHCSFDHLVGAHQDGGRNGQTECLGGP